MQKTIDEAINETAEKIATVLNESGLPISVVKLILTNTLYQVQQLEYNSPAPTQDADRLRAERRCEEAKEDAES